MKQFFLQASDELCEILIALNGGRTLMRNIGDVLISADASANLVWALAGAGVKGQQTVVDANDEPVISAMLLHEAIDPVPHYRAGLPPVLAVDVQAATPIVEQIVREIAGQLDLRIDDFYTCEPSTTDLYNPGEKKVLYTAGQWGVRLSTQSIDIDEVSYRFNQHPSISHVTSIAVRTDSVPDSHRVVLSFGLQARILQ